MLARRPKALISARFPEVAEHASVKYQTRAGRAKRDEDYTHVEGELFFAPHEQEQAVLIHIANSLAFESNEAKS